MIARRAMLHALATLLALAPLMPMPALAQPAQSQTAAPASQARPSQTPSSPPAPSQGAPSQVTPAQSAVPPVTGTGGQPPAQSPAAGAAAGTPAAAPGSEAAQAAPALSGPAYDIEVVIFRAKAALGQQENWTSETSASATVAGGEASNGSGQVGKLLTVLSSSDYRLTSIATRLRTSGTYEPVAHAAWVQTASAWGTRGGFPLEDLGINVPGLSGVIYLERGQYLHLGMTLNYTMQDPPTSLNAPPGTTFVMNETRRVRFYQRNYYDHPAFGVIALITPARGLRQPGR
jgi:hypothetical protein